MTYRIFTAATTILLTAGSAYAHPRDHSHMAWNEMAQHFAGSPSHLPALLLVGGVLAGIAAWRLASASAKPVARRSKS